ncbi:MAG: hypothetical protein U5N86_14055 [Planctomycetota bacterium]|nr:hypothetical protein [Planctomycetota bacterium]
MSTKELVDIINVSTPLLVALLTLLAAYLGHKWTKRTALKTAICSSDYIMISSILTKAINAIYILTEDSKYIGLELNGRDVSRENADYARLLLRKAEADAGIHLPEDIRVPRTIGFVRKRAKHNKAAADYSKTVFFEVPLKTTIP